MIKDDVAARVAALRPGDDVVLVVDCTKAARYRVPGLDRRGDVRRAPSAGRLLLGIVLVPLGLLVSGSANVSRNAVVRADGPDALVVRWMRSIDAAPDSMHGHAGGLDLGLRDKGFVCLAVTERGALLVLRKLGVGTSYARADIWWDSTRDGRADVVRRAFGGGVRLTFPDGSSVVLPTQLLRTHALRRRMAG